MNGVRSRNGRCTTVSDIETEVNRKLSELGIEMEVTTDYGYFGDDWPRGSHHYRVRFTRDGKGVFTTEFHQGSAHTKEPTAADVLSCLFGDAQSVLDFDFEEWIEEFGYADEPLRDLAKYRKMYDACEQTWRDLLRLSGYDYARYDHLRDLVSDL